MCDLRRPLFGGKSCGIFLCALAFAGKIRYNKQEYRAPGHAQSLSHSSGGQDTEVPMAKKRRKNRKGLGIGSVLIVLLVGLAILLYPYIEQWLEIPSDSPTSTPVDGQVTVHVIDVGQADSILLVTPAGNMLIDAGTNAAESRLKSYLDALGIRQFEYLVLTHPHEDHIGGADMILREYTVKNVVMPNVTATSKTYESVIDALEKSQANVIEAHSGETFSLGDLICRVLAPNSAKYSSTNDYSVVLRATYGEVSMMFTGDAEGNKQGESEKEILKTYTPADLRCDFLKVGHHGSDTSTSPEFLKAVSPKIAAISVGEGNTYGHPVQSTLDALDAAGVTCYRTDRLGSLVFVCDGKTIEYRKN